MPQEGGGSMGGSSNGGWRGGRRLMDWAGRADHLGGIPRRAVIFTVGTWARVVANVLNTTTVHNGNTLLNLVRSRPQGMPLITVSNHMSTLDDPVMWGFKEFPITDAKLARWALAAKDICFKNSLLSYFFRLGKCIPIIRGGGIYQEHMDEALNILNHGGWLHIFPEGKVYQDADPIKQLKWGTASLIARAHVIPIVLPIIHFGFEKVMPEKYFFGRRPLLPLCMKSIKIAVGEPIELNLTKLRQEAKSAHLYPPFRSLGWPKSSPDDLDEAAQRWLYICISDKIRAAMEKLRLQSIDRDKTIV